MQGRCANPGASVEERAQEESLTSPGMSSTEHIHSAWVPCRACALAAHVEAICGGRCHLLPQRRGLRGREGMWSVAALTGLAAAEED